MDSRRKSLFFVAVAASGLAWWLSGTSASRTEEAQARGVGLDRDALKRHVHYLASDELAGRGVGTEGDTKATEYLEEQLRSAGLEPLFSAPDGAKRFFQPFAVRSRELEEASYVLRRGDRRLALVPGRDDSIRWTDAAHRATFPLVYLGYGIREPELGWDDYAGMGVDPELTGRCAVVEIGVPDESASWPEEVVARYRNPDEGNLVKVENVMSVGGTCVIAISPRDASMPWSEIIKESYSSFVDVREAGGVLFPDILLLSLSQERTGALFEGEPFDPTTERGRYHAFTLETSLELSLSLHEQTLHTRNVGGLVPGTDPELADELVTLSAHHDGLGVVGGAIMNGANDNAASVAAMLEAARIQALHPSRRPVVFLFFAAEESGLLGSHYFLESPPVPLENVVVNVNYEMVGGDIGRGFNVNGTTALSSDLRPVLDAANDSGPRAAFDFKSDRRNGGGWVSVRSDHYNFFKRGIPILYFVGGGTSYYHMSGDDAGTVDYDRTLEAAWLAFALAQEVGNRPSRPRVDM